MNRLLQYRVIGWQACLWQSKRCLRRPGDHGDGIRLSKASFHRRNGHLRIAIEARSGYRRATRVDSGQTVMPAMIAHVHILRRLYSGGENYTPATCWDHSSGKRYGVAATQS